MDGIVLIDKPKNWTSFDVVAKTRSLLRTQLIANSSQPITRAPKVKVGHTGTLDPLATGLLIIVVGSYCKRAREFSKLDKTYEAELSLGYTSSTDDDEGKKTKKSDKVPDLSEVDAALNTFLGEQMQSPPAFSAIKTGGQRAYKLAREGKEVTMEPRNVTIHDISGIEYDYPKLRFTASVSSGTYIRSLARDVGEYLGTGAYLSGLRRISVGDYRVDDAVTVEEFSPMLVKPV